MKKSDIESVMLITYTGNPVRLKYLMYEMDRIGLSDRVHKIIQFPTPFDKFLIKRIPHTSEMSKGADRVNLWFGHYRAIKTAYESGHSITMIVEDDIRFVRNTDLIWKALDELPPGFTVATLDPICDNQRHYRNGKGNGQSVGLSNWGFTIGGVPLHSTGCYILDRKGMEIFIGLYESVVIESCPFRMMRPTDDWWSDVAKKAGRLYYAVPNLAVQAAFKNSKSLRGRYSNAAQVSYYHRMSLNKNNYMEYPESDDCEKGLCEMKAISSFEAEINKLLLLKALPSCKNIIVMANHNSASPAPDKLVKALESDSPENSCLVLLNHAGTWKHIPEAVRKRFKVILWIRRYSDYNNKYLGDDGTVSGDNVIQLYMHGDGRIPKRNLTYELPETGRLMNDFVGDLAARGIPNNPTTGGFTGGVMGSLFGKTSNVILRGFDGNYDTSLYEGLGHASLKCEHVCLSEYHNCVLTGLGDILTEHRQDKAS